MTRYDDHPHSSPAAAPGVRPDPAAVRSPRWASPPGVPEFSIELRGRLQAALASRGDDYVPRTRLRRDDGGPQFVNRLIFEDSPYLLQHAHNPVSWYSWGAEAFAAARELDRPVFLSIGYSTCHWCHVMEEESFDNPDVARVLNERFVAVKVDREQRPDVDEIYMTAVLLVNGHGGWPMTSFLTPDGEPFFGATYFPPDQLVKLLLEVEEAWKQKRIPLTEQASRLASSVRQLAGARGVAGTVGSGAFREAVAQLVDRCDTRRGGFGGAPKFPHEPELLLLLDAVRRSGDVAALRAAVTSLEGMARGGICDQIGGGFARYSTDADWLVPHFEKMLYNQAHLARAYALAYELTGDWFLGRVARQTIDYVLRDLTSPDGAFYSATDADSEGHEGRFFLWTPAQLREALSPDDAALAIDLYQVTAGGNFEGASILHLPMPLGAFAAARRMTLAELLPRVDRIRDRLYQERERRIHPLRDDKILASWNGMMITSLAVAAETLGEPRYLDAAIRGAEAVWKTHRRAAESGGEGAGGTTSLWRVHLDGSSSVVATLDDYACLAEAMVTLSDVTGEERWLARSRALADAMLAGFWDEANGGFFMSAEGEDPFLLARPKITADTAIPSGNSVAIRALALLGARTGEARYRARAEQALSAFARPIAEQPSGYAYMLVGAGELLQGPPGWRGYGANGALRAEARLGKVGAGEYELEVALDLRPGWHINASAPRQDYLTPTALSVAGGRGGEWRLGRVEYPEARTVQLPFAAEALAVYEGKAKIRAEVSWGGAATTGAGVVPVLAVRLAYQACDERACLAPEELVLRVPAAGVLR
ncbi:MAG: thioredoxin domain-containing protein [Candidatus Schekmanbacteria bacterium]|nr:thioredoxin domain-containing protein [Candidatus Schekmanbacteria bacterium]